MKLITLALLVALAAAIAVNKHQVNGKWLQTILFLDQLDGSDSPPVIGYRFQTTSHQYSFTSSLIGMLFRLLGRISYWVDLLSTPCVGIGLA